jgi:hypothetical protein
MPAMQFVYVKIPLLDGVAEDIPRLHEALERVLTEADAGGLIGWGTSLADTRDHGPGALPHHRLDIEVQDHARGLQLLREALVQLGCPDGTELHYTELRQALQTVYRASAWTAPGPSTAATRPRH